MDHGTYRELAAGAALDDLDATERESLDAHLGSCPPCRDAARELVDAAGLLAFAVPQRRPPGALRGGVLAAIAASDSGPVRIPSPIVTALPSREPALPAREPEATAPATLAALDAARRERTRYRRLSIAGLAVAAALAIAVGGLGVTAAGLRSDLEAATSERDAAVARLATSDGAMSVVLAPDHATASLAPEPMAAGAEVYVVYRPGTAEAWLMAGNLPATPSGKVYQLWSADTAGVHPLTTFTCDGTHACLAPFGIDLAAAKATMITLEADGGAQGEPGPQVAFGELEG